MSGTGHFFLNSHEMPTISSRNNSQSNSLDEKNKERGEETVNENDDEDYKPRSTFGILRVKETDSVPGSVLLLSGAARRNAPLGMRHAPPTRSASSLPSQFAGSVRSGSSLRSPGTPAPEKKRTPDGKIILDPQPDDSKNDPLNWSALRRDAALGSLGLYCLVGGGMTPILAAGFTNVSEEYNVTIAKIALTTGLYMMGLGVGSVVMSPTAIKFGKRPVYLMTAITFVLSAVWCALSPSYVSLLVARVFQGIAVSPTECLPSASIAEIFFLHERAYRLGIYTLLLLGGKNLIPLISAAIIESLSWRWVFWIVAMVVGFTGVLLFFFVPETFWDRTPRPHAPRPHHKRPALFSRTSSGLGRSALHLPWTPHSPLSRRTTHAVSEKEDTTPKPPERPALQSGNSTQDITEANKERGRPRARKAHFDLDEADRAAIEQAEKGGLDEGDLGNGANTFLDPTTKPDRPQSELPTIDAAITQQDFIEVDLHEAPTHSRTSHRPPLSQRHSASPKPGSLRVRDPSRDPEAQRSPDARGLSNHEWTAFYQKAPPKTFTATLKPYDGRLNSENWLKLAARPFVLFAYPAILWSAAVYAMSIGWLIVLSEAVATIYRDSHTYNFTALQAGLVYISPFLGGVLGTAVAGKVSDFIVRAMARRNGGLYEPEFRLVMAIPVALATTIGLMGFGWSAEEHDAWIVPTVFFGIISFGCSLGSTTAITFAVDSYRVYAGEALVTLNFSKNILHGLVFSLFFSEWLESEGSRQVFLCLGGIQLFCLLWTVPIYVYGKRARMWTARRRFVERL